MKYFSDFYISYRRGGLRIAMVSAVKATKRIAVALYEQARWKEIVEAQVRAETGAEGVHGQCKNFFLIHSNIKEKGSLFSGSIVINSA